MAAGSGVATDVDQPDDTGLAQHGAELVEAAIAVADGEDPHPRTMRRTAAGVEGRNG
jgi:hypothetical protein